MAILISEPQPLAAPAIVERPPGAWGPAKVEIFRQQFFEFARYVKINSKDDGPIILGDHIYQAQHRFLNAVFDALENDIHKIFVLKSRQLGLSTISRCLTLFWNGIHPGLKGYVVLDTGPHKEEARLELLNMIKGLPPKLGFPTIKRENRDLLELDNDSLMNFAAAGVKTSKSSGTLGRSSGVNFAHLSELCSFSDPEGLESFDNSLSDRYPDRLYIYESTARGTENVWHDMWTQAVDDPHHSQTCFIGWYHKETQQIPESDPDFNRYGLYPPSEKEVRMIEEVKELYGYDITPPQLAWYRRKMDPTALPDGDAPPEYIGDTIKIQEQPCTAEEAFQQTGSSFFDGPNLAKVARTTASNKFKCYRYEAGIEFIDLVVRQAFTARTVELKVWEEPLPQSTYIVAVDPAHGANEKNDRSAIQVFRCYADGLEQVAEYAWPLITTKQLGWVVMSLCAWYSTQESDVYTIIELQGGGDAVWEEMQEVRRLISGGYLRSRIEAQGMQNILQNVKNYIYTRSDSMSAGRNWQWKTTHNLKVKIMERMRDFLNNGMLSIRSYATIEEMKSIRREGDSIEAGGSKKDDRVIAVALAVHCWEQRARRVLVAQKRTREADNARRRGNSVDIVRMFNRSQLDSVMSIKARQRRAAAAEARRRMWRGR